MAFQKRNEDRNIVRYLHFLGAPSQLQRKIENDYHSDMTIYKLDKRRGGKNKHKKLFVGKPIE